MTLDSEAMIKRIREEKELVLSEEDYEPYSTDDGYICPYCGEFTPVEDNYELYNDGDHTVYCSHCDKSFIVNTYVSYSFESRKEA